MSNVNTNTFISRENIEKTHNVQLPVFYDQKTVKILLNIHASLNHTLNPSLERHAPNPQRENHWYHYIPSSIRIGNTTNISASAFSSIDMSNNSTTVINNSPSKPLTQQEIAAKKKKEDEEAANTKRQLFGAVSGVIMVAASYFVGQSIQELAEANEDLEDLEDLKLIVRDTENHRQNLYKHQINATSSNILDHQIERLNDIVNNPIMPGKRTNAIRDLAIRTSMFVGGVIGIVGAFVIHSEPVMKFSGAVLLLTGCTWALKRGIGSDKERLNQKINEINQDITLLLGVLNTLPKLNAAGVVTMSPAHMAAGPEHLFGDVNVIYYDTPPSAPPM